MRITCEFDRSLHAQIWLMTTSICNRLNGKKKRRKSEGKRTRRVRPRCDEKR